MANDNLSGIILTAYLCKYIQSLKNRYWSYRIVFLPETVGAIAYCKKNEKKMKKINFGLVICNVGGTGNFSFKESFDKDHFLNDVVRDTFNDLKIRHKTHPFDINGSDERQYSSQFFKINICSIFKDKYYDFKQYHTSHDNLKFVKAENIFKSLKIYQKLILNIEKQVIYKAINTKCETMLSRHNLYPKLGGQILPKDKHLSETEIILWILFLSDGKKTVDQICKRLKIKKTRILVIYSKLEKKKLVKKL
jgi:aminopeptidase-like protein